MHPEQQTRALEGDLGPLSLEDRLVLIADHFSNAVFTTSLGKEDQVVTHAIARGGAAVRLATLQTGRLFPETLALLAQTKQHYGIEIEAFHPVEEAVADYVDTYGNNGFYDSLEARHACCHIRKTAPLKQLLAGADAWLTGIRRGQSDDRSTAPIAEWSAEHNLMKLNVLADWSDVEINAMIDEHDIPINPLHARNYPSIGCEPCTRAIKPGEPERAGRWWWEQDTSRECGLHVTQS